MKKIMMKIGAGVMLLLGIGLLAYPAAASYVHQRNDTGVIRKLENQLRQSDDEAVEMQCNLARWYNLNLTAEQPEENFMEAYYDILDYSDHVMGYIAIPAIGERLPIYHGTGDEVLSKGVGHVPETAFPVGGEGNHTVLMGCSNRPGAENFSDLGELEVGDLFYIHVLDKVLAYRVEEVQKDTETMHERIKTIPGEDLCTLVTYTTHSGTSSKLLVRGTRAEHADQEVVTPVEEGAQEMGWIGIAVSAVLLAGFIPLLILGSSGDGKNKK